MRALLGDLIWLKRSAPNDEEGSLLAAELRKVSRENLAAQLTTSQLLWVEECFMWLIYGLWRYFGDRAHQDLFPDLQSSWAGEIYQRMRAHYAHVQMRQHLHSSRQGIKKKDWVE